MAQVCGARAVRPGGEPGTELVVDYARALLCIARGSLAKALTALHSATQMEGLLAGEHAFAPVVRARLVRTEARMGGCLPRAPRSTLPVTRSATSATCARLLPSPVSHKVSQSMRSRHSLRCSTVPLRCFTGRPC
jgi:hypothetical protein